MAIQKGATVKFTSPIIQGNVITKKYDEATDSFLYLVEYADESGDIHQRYFDESQLTVV